MDFGFRAAGRAAALVLALALMVHPASAFGEVAAPPTVQGRVIDSLGRPLAGALLEVKNASGAVLARARSDANGSFQFPGLPAGTYEVDAQLSAFEPGIAIVTLRPDQAATPLTLSLASAQALEISVSAEPESAARNALREGIAGSAFQFSPQDIQNLPQGESTPLNQVLLRAPGVSQDSFGQVHVRGDHGNLQYRIDGVMLPESIGGFGQALDTHFIQSMDLLTGALPAQYGFRTAGVVDIQTKSGAFADQGSISLMGGSFSTQEYSAQYGGHSGALNYFFSGSFLSDNLGIENPTASYNAIHDATQQEKGFGYLSYLINPESRLAFIFGSADNHFQIPNNPGQTPLYQLSGYPHYSSSNLTETQDELTRFGVLALQGTVGPDLDYQLSLFSRYTTVRFNPDYAGDLIFTGVASQATRSGLDNGLQLDTTYRPSPAHTLRAGLFLSDETLLSNTSSNTFPCCDASGNQLSTVPIGFNNNFQKNAYQEGVYVQDQWQALPALTVNYGLRADYVNAYVQGGQISPRLGLVYKAFDQTTLHAGYARYFTPPPTELITGKTLSDFENTTNAPLNPQNDPVKPERSNYYDVGINQQFGSHLSLSLDGYYKRVTDLLDEGQFGSALLFTPFNYQEGRIYGVEFTATYKSDVLSAYFNIARADALGRTIVSSQYNFAPNELAYIANNFIHLDHDQAVTASAGLTYSWHTIRIGVDDLYGTGLRSGFANTEHLPAYNVTNLSVSDRLQLSSLGDVEARLSLINLFDKVYEIRDGTGVGVGAPQFGQRRSVFLRLTKYF
jgi:outer membrane receptor protein involved in Fe transport